MPNREAISNLEDHVGYWLRFVSNQVSHGFKTKVEAQGVTVAEWVVMRDLFDHADATNPSQLADRLGMTRGAISKLVDRLRAKQYVAREFSDDDRRFQTISLTTAGRKLVPKLARLADENDDEFFGHLSEQDHSRLVVLLQNIVKQHGWKNIPID
jgi:DNA-binding MarR family transcriptional regulator